MDLSRTQRLIASCGGAAIVVAAAVVVWMGLNSQGGSAERGREIPDLLPAGLAPAKTGGTVGLPGGPGPLPEGAVSAGPPALPVSEAPGSITENLVLREGETHYGKGEAFFKDGDFTSASRYLRAEVERHPDRFYPTYLLGISLWKEGKTDEAITTLTSAVALDESSTKARVNLGRVLNDAGLFERALEIADEAIALDASRSKAHNVRGRALLNLGRPDEAIEAFRVAIEKDSGDAYAQNNLGYALIGAGRFAEALPYLEEAVRLKPEAGYFQNNLGMACEHTAQIDRAKEAYRKAVQAGGSDSAERNLTRLGGALDEETPEVTSEDPAK